MACLGTRTVNDVILKYKNIYWKKLRPKIIAQILLIISKETY